MKEYPRIRRFDIGDEKHVRLEMGSGNSRPVTEVELRQLRDELNADAAERARPQSRLDVDARAFVIEQIRFIPDAFDDAHLPEDFEYMTPEPPAWTPEPHESGHQWWYRAWNRQRRLLTFDSDIEAWYLLDDGHVNEAPSPLRGYTRSNLRAFAEEGDMFAPATIPEPPS